MEGSNYPYYWKRGLRFIYNRWNILIFLLRNGEANERNTILFFFPQTPLPFPILENGNASHKAYYECESYDNDREECLHFVFA